MNCWTNTKLCAVCGNTAHHCQDSFVLPCQIKLDVNSSLNLVQKLGLVNPNAGRAGWLAQMEFASEFGDRDYTNGQLEKGVKWDLCFNSRLGPSIEC
jgi:hypothetical protein